MSHVETTAQSASASPDSPRTYRYAWYSAGVLMFAYAFSFLDRYIVNLMVGPIRADLGISDFEFSLLTGAAFGIFYTAMGLPLGWAADRFIRTRIAAIGIALWSAATVCCGLAQNYAQLFLARMGVGIGEASLSPSAYSLLSDYFDKSRLPRAMSIYTSGIFIGAGVALILGGAVVSAIQSTPEVELPLIGAMRSWKVAFIVVGAPGLLMALWTLTLREPPRRDVTVAADKQKVSDVFVYLKQYKWMSVSLFLGGALYSMTTYTDQWYPELFIRTWGWTPRQSGFMNGLATVIGGPVGLFVAGWLTTRMLRNGTTDACLRLIGYGSLLLALIAAILPLMPSAGLMAFMLFPFKFFIALNPVLVPSAIQMVAPNQLRAQLGALFLVCVGVLGLTLGPILPAAITDFVFRDDAALRYSLSLSAVIIGPPTFLAFRAGLEEYRQAFADAEFRRGASRDQA
jgi:MFS family permease